MIMMKTLSYKSKLHHKQEKRREVENPLLKLKMPRSLQQQPRREAWPTRNLRFWVRSVTVCIIVLRWRVEREYF